MTAQQAFEQYDSRHPDDRLHLFEAMLALLAPSATVLYPGSYIDVSPSFVFDDVTYVDVDRRAARFFDEPDLAAFVAARSGSGRIPRIEFVHADYTTPLPLEERSFDLLVSLYAGFVSPACKRYLRDGGLLLVNPSHGDASMAAIDPEFTLAAVVECRGERYVTRDRDLDGFLVPRRGTQPTAAELRAMNRGIAYTRTPFAYLFSLAR